MVVGRFAPSPTGPLHSGSLVAALASWLCARIEGGRWLLRIDDLDHQRCRQQYEDDILATLEHCGLYWDGPVYRQSAMTSHYEDAFRKLQALSALYPCVCSRSQIAQLASAPAPGEEVPYPGTCRVQKVKTQDVRAWRVALPERSGIFYDLWHGAVSYELNQLGDPVIKRAEGIFAYIFAAVVDDAVAGVTQVVRGEDLMGVTPRQIYLQELLGVSTPCYGHVPLVTGPDGSKLSKRDHTVSSWGYGHDDTSRALTQALTFLGYRPDESLIGAPCPDLLQWALGVFKPGVH